MRDGSVTWHVTSVLYPWICSYTSGVAWSGVDPLLIRVSCLLGSDPKSPDASDIVCCVLSLGSLHHCGQLQPSLMGNLMMVDAV
jgi:hypothetical protein